MALYCWQKAAPAARTPAGTWEFDGTTTYSFDGSGSGAMELPSISYDFAYTIDGNKLMIDYANESVRDSEYEFTVDGNPLTLIGGEGTVGGTYELSGVCVTRCPHSGGPYGGI